MAAGDVMTSHIALLADDYIALRRGLGYRSPSQQRALRAFARYLDRQGHEDESGLCGDPRFDGRVPFAVEAPGGPPPGKPRATRYASSRWWLLVAGD